MDEALKCQHSKDQASAYVLTERLDCKQRVRINSQPLQEQMDQDMSHRTQRQENQDNLWIQEVDSERDSQHD